MKKTDENKNQFGNTLEEQLENVFGGEDTDTLRLKGKPIPLPEADPYKH